MSLQIIESELLFPNNLDLSAINKLIGSIKHNTIDDGDLYFQLSEEESWYLEDSKIKTGGYSIDQGVGIRVVSEDKTGFAYSTNLEIKNISSALAAAQHIGQQKNKIINNNLKIKKDIKPIYQPNNPIYSINSNKKIEILKYIDTFARSLDPRVSQVIASISGFYDMILICNFDGYTNSDLRPLVSLSITITVQAHDKTESSRTGCGGRGNYLDFFDINTLNKIISNAVKEALTNLDAKPAPAGTYPVVLGPGWPGVLLHEAVGHGLEADFNRKGLSAFSNKIGKKVAANGVTVIDDGSIENKRGSLRIDDEGTPTQKTILIDNGILVNYMQDKLNARLMGMQPTGNCRRESYAQIPMPRMTNTFLANGQHSTEEMISSIKKGIYAINFSGGQVDITSGQFVFSSSHAYMIENGKITYPVKGATIIGNGPEIMNKISMIGNDFSFDSGVGTCGKNGQSVPVGVGQPSLKIDSITIGGTSV